MEQALPPWTACHLPAGSVLQLGGMAQGCRSYLAVRGGFDATAGAGQPQRGPARAHRPPSAAARCRPATFCRSATPRRLSPACLPAGGSRALALGPGSAALVRFRRRSDRPAAGQPYRRCSTSARSSISTAGGFRVHAASNRTGCRLDGPTLALRQPLELISEAALPGTMQLPPSGQPIVLMAEAPVTGGYPRIGQVAAVDLPRLAQRRPGDTRKLRADHAGAGAGAECAASARTAAPDPQRAATDWSSAHENASTSIATSANRSAPGAWARTRRCWAWSVRPTSRAVSMPATRRIMQRTVALAVQPRRGDRRACLAARPAGLRPPRDGRQRRPRCMR